MRVLSERWSARILPVLIPLTMVDGYAVLSPTEGDATPGIRKLALSSYSEREPLTLQPGAASRQSEMLGTYSITRCRRSVRDFAG
jgi:hypothetical protein